MAKPPYPPRPFMQPHVESATVYGLRRGALLLFVPKYHLKARGGLEGGLEMACRGRSEG